MRLCKSSVKSMPLSVRWNPFLFDSNFPNGYSLYHKVADLFDTFEGKFIPALRLLLVYLGDKCQRVPLLITRLRFWHCGWGSVTSYVQIPPFSHNCRKSRSVVTIMGYHLPNCKRVQFWKPRPFQQNIYVHLIIKDECQGTVSIAFHAFWERWSSW